MSPSSIKRWITKLTPVSLWTFAFFSLAGLVDALYISPPDYLHGELVRILYVHVPAAWLSVSIYGVMGICSFISIVLRSPFYSLCAQSLAIPGCILTVICIVTGSIWGKPAWGTWWVWDARLTSVLVLFFLYVGYLNFCDNGLNKASCVLNIVGLVNLPIIKWSVDWWFTLHQPSSFSLNQKPAIANEMLIALLLMAVAFAAWSLAIFSMKFTKLLQNFQRNNHG